MSSLSTPVPSTDCGDGGLAVTPNLEESSVPESKLETTVDQVVGTTATVQEPKTKVCCHVCGALIVYNGSPYCWVCSACY